jgi:Tfp pilus assembly protein PilP
MGSADMKHLLLAGVLLGIVSCRHDDDSLKYEKVQVERYEPDVRIEPQGENLQYMAFCTDEGRALGPWVDSRSEAQSAASSYHGEHPDRDCTVIWREKPGKLKFKSQ